MATRRHSLLAANRRNMGLFEEAYSQTQAFNDPVVQRRKALGHIADTGKEIYAGWKQLESAAWKHRRNNPPERPDVGGIISEDDVLEDDFEIEETGFDSFEPWEAPPGQTEYHRRISGDDPYEPTHVATQGGKTSFTNNVTPESVNNYVSWVVNDQPPATQPPATFQSGQKTQKPKLFGKGSFLHNLWRVSAFGPDSGQYEDVFGEGSKNLPQTNKGDI